MLFGQEYSMSNVEGELLVFSLKKQNVFKRPKCILIVVEPERVELAGRVLQLAILNIH